MIYLIEEFDGDTQREMAMKLLKYGLAHEYGITIEVNVDCEEKGKPYLSDYPDICFNYSHSKVGVLCAIAADRVGADIEGVISYRDRLAQRICHPNELKKLADAVDKDRLLTRIWVAKESYLKYTGEGIRSDLRLLDFSVCSEIFFRRYGCNFMIVDREKSSMAICSDEVCEEINIVHMEDIGSR